MTSVWLARNYPGIDQVIAVEPDPDNARLCRQNLHLNGINAELIEAAIGPCEGTGKFLRDRMSNLGHLSDRGLPVRTTTVDAVLKECGHRAFALAKIDIEGAEQQLFQGSTGWLDQMDRIIIELHPAVVDCSQIVDTLTSRGFTYVPSNSVFPGNMDSFIKK
jgi:FkbM family methyltransferase